MPAWSARNQGEIDEIDGMVLGGDKDQNKFLGK
jgi:hypothetical protein